MAVSLKQKSLRRAFAALLSLGSILSATAGLEPAFGQEKPISQWTITNTQVALGSAPTGHQSIQMVINTSRELTADRAFKRVRIQNPTVLTALPLEGGNRLQISALQTGVTQIDLVGADESVYSVEVMVLGDVRELESILRQIFPTANLVVTPVQKGCIISGFVTSDEDIETVISIAEMYFPTVINKVTVTGVHTIQLETQVMEVSRTKLRQLGIDWAFANGDDRIVSNVSGAISSVGSTFLPSNNSTMHVAISQGGSDFLLAIQALRANNLVKVLANPTLTAVDGRPASFNSGGEIPIVVPSGLGQVGIQYREFGTRIDFVAKIRGEGRIYLEVRPYVSEIDPTRGVTIEGTSVPGLRSRFLETGVELQAGQTLALGGLLQSRTETVNSGFPGLADLPYFGAFFRTTRELQNEIELLITVTPHFAGPMDPHEVPMGGPGANTGSPTDHELYWKSYIETPLVQDGYCAPGMSGIGLINNEYGSNMTEQGMVSGSSGSTVPQGMLNSTPVPNPAAMSVGPNAPRMASPSTGGVRTMR